MSFKPMNLGSMDGAVTQPHDRDALTLSPSASAVPTTQSGALSNGGSCRDRLGVAYRTDELKIHSATLARWLGHLARAQIRRTPAITRDG